MKSSNGKTYASRRGTDKFRVAEGAALIALKHSIAASSVRQYTGMLANYAEWSMKTLASEGIQAQKRLKAYQEHFNSALSHGNFDTNSNYRKLNPILRLASKLYEQRDFVGLRIIATVLRIHELAKPSRRFINEEISSLVNNPDLFTKVEDVTIDTVNDPIPIESFYRQWAEHDIPLSNEAVANGFPLEQFCSWLDTQDWLKDVLYVFCAEPEFEALAAPNQSATSFLKKQKSGRDSWKSVPNMVSADMENILVQSWGSNPTLYEEFANGLADIMKPPYGAHFTLNKDAVKDIGEFIRDVKPRMRFNRVALTGIEASAGIKARLIHKGSYLVVYSLSNLADTLMDILAWLPECYVQSHELGFRYAVESFRKRHYAAGTDATAWTDYFPLWLCVEVFSRLVDHNTRLVTGWTRLMRSVEYYQYSNGNTVESGYGYLRRGTSMGIPSGWAITTLAHCLLFRFAAHVAGIEPDRIIHRTRGAVTVDLPVYDHRFVVIGDDEDCFSREVSSIYTTLTESLGIKINHAKSMVADPDNGTHLMEFVKRQALDGVEVTGLSAKVTCSHLSDYMSLQAYVSLAHERGLDLDWDHFYDKLLNGDILTKVVADSKSRKFLRREVEIGLRIPTSLGGLLSDEEAESRFDPQIAFDAMLALVSSLAKSATSRGVRGRNGNEKLTDLMDSLRWIHPKNQNYLNMGASTLAKYDREQFSASKSWSVVDALIRDFLMSIEPLIRQTSSFAEANTSVIRKFVQIRSEVARILRVPHYLGNDFERKLAAETVRSLAHSHAERYIDETVSDATIERMYAQWTKVYNRLISASNLGRPRVGNHSHKDMEKLYADLFG